MNINQDPLSRRESSRPPTPAELAAMEATRNRVREADASRREVAQERIEQARAEAETARDRIEISARARAAAASETSHDDRRAALERLRQDYKEGRLNTPERAQRAAESILRPPSEE